MQCPIPENSTDWRNYLPSLLHDDTGCPLSIIFRYIPFSIFWRFPAFVEDYYISPYFLHITDVSPASSAMRLSPGLSAFHSLFHCIIAAAVLLFFGIAHTTPSISPEMLHLSFLYQFPYIFYIPDDEANTAFPP